MSNKTDGNRPPVVGIFVTLLTLVVIVALGVLIAIVIASQFLGGI